ncbi:MAG TPA: AAA family ATPase, partial [Candidatus Nanoarchaeia archaeon]|nr:AAA family ATPase [Candidatus Nanoarchaeia archaeon]
MELIIIYGPPASGKLTVAKELEKITGFNVLHNHLTGDISSAIYNFGSKRYKKFVRKLRKIILKEASKSEAKIIFT